MMYAYNRPKLNSFILSARLFRFCFLTLRSPLFGLGNAQSELCWNCVLFECMLSVKFIKQNLQMCVSTDLKTSSVCVL